MPTSTAAKVGRGFIGAARLHLEIRGLLRFALGACQKTFVILILLHLDHLALEFNFMAPKLCCRVRAIRPHLVGRHATELLRLHLALLDQSDQVGIFP